MYDVVTVGEGMLRLSPPRYERIRRARTLDVHMCGSQGNVACNIARLGLKTAFVTKLPDNALGLLAKDHYMSCGVDASHIKLVPGSRLGVNYIEFGATPRASAVVYDRKGQRRQHDCPRRFRLGRYPRGDAAGLYRRHFSGPFRQLPPRQPWSSSPRPSGTAAWSASTSTTASTSGRRKKPRRCMSEIIQNVDILITTQWDSEIVFGYQGSYEEIIRRFHDDFGCQIVAITLREVYDVLRGAWNTMVLHEGNVLHGQKYDIDVIDRFGAGDSWGSGSSTPT